MAKCKRKVCFVTSNRSDFSKLDMAISATKAHPDLTVQLIVTGAHLLSSSDNTVREISKKFKIDEELYIEVTGSNPSTMAKSVGLLIIELSTVFTRLQPDIVVVHGDRYESLAVAVTASMLNIHLAHIEGGELSGSIDGVIRPAITKLSNTHFVSNETSKKTVEDLGGCPDNVFNIGCAGIELLMKTPIVGIEETISRVNTKLVKSKTKMVNSDYILVIHHPVTTEYGLAGLQVTEILEALTTYEHQFVFIWPNIDPGNEHINRVYRSHRVLKLRNTQIFKHITTDLFVNVLNNASCMVGNSSSGIREACYFGTPVVNVGSRQAGRLRGNNIIDTDCDRDEIRAAIDVQLAQKRYPIDRRYGNGSAGVELADTCSKIDL